MWLCFTIRIHSTSLILGLPISFLLYIVLWIQIDPNSYHLTERGVDVTEDNTETAESTETTEMDNNNPLTLDDSGKWYWSYHTKQWFPLTVDDSGNWFWSYEKLQWMLMTLQSSRARKMRMRRMAKISSTFWNCKISTLYLSFVSLYSHFQLFSNTLCQ